MILLCRVGWLVDRSVGRSIGWLVGGSVGRSIGWLFGGSVRRSFCWLVLSIVLSLVSYCRKYENTYVCYRRIRRGRLTVNAICQELRGTTFMSSASARKQKSFTLPFIR